MILGELSTGKEELLKKYTSFYFQEDLKLTIGTDFYSKTIILKNKTLKIQFWDVNWEHRQGFLIPLYFRGSNGAIIIYDISNSKTLKHLSKWARLIRENAGDIPIVLIGNITNLEKSRDVLREEAIKIAKKYNFSGFAEISTKTGENVEQTFESIAEILMNQTNKN